MRVSRYGGLAFRIYGASPDDLLGWPMYRLQFERSPTEEALDRIGLAAAWARGSGHGDRWLWAGRFLFAKLFTDGNYQLNNSMFEAIDEAWPLREVVCLTAHTRSVGDHRQAEEESIAAQPQPDPGPTLGSSSGRFTPMHDGGHGEPAVLPAFEQALRRAQAEAAGTPYRHPWQMFLRPRLAAGEVELEPAPVRRHPTGPGRAAEPTGPRARLAWTDSSLAVVLDDIEIPIDDLPLEGSTIAAVAVNPAGTRGAYVTARGDALWVVDLDSGEVAPALWSGAVGPLRGVEWLDDERLLTFSDERVAALSCRMYAAEVRSVHPRGARLWLLDRRLVVTSTGAGCTVNALRPGGALARVAELACDDLQAAELDERGLVLTSGRGQEHRVRNLEAACYRAAREETAAAGEVVYAQGEPRSGSDERGTWFEDASGSSVMVLRSAAGDELVRRADGKPIAGETGAVAGPRLRVWPLDWGFLVHDGATVWHIHGDRLAIRLREALEVDELALARVSGEVRLLVAGGGRLSLWPDGAGGAPLWSIPAPPIDLLAGDVDLAAIRSRGERLLLVRLHAEGPLLLGAWPGHLPAPAAAWIAGGHLCARVRRGADDRWFRAAPPAAALALDSLSGDGAPELSVAAGGERRAALQSAAEADLLQRRAEIDAQRQPVAVSASARAGLLGLTATGLEPDALVSPGDQLARPPSVMRNRRSGPLLVGVEVGTPHAMHAVDLPLHTIDAGACALHPTRALGLVICQDLLLVDLDSGGVTARAPVWGDSFTSAAFAGDHHAVATSERGGFLILFRDTGADLVEVSRLRLPFQQTIASAAGPGGVILTAGKRLGGHSLQLCAFAIDGDQLLDLDRLDTNIDSWRLGRTAGGELLVTVEPGQVWRTQPGRYRLTGLDRIETAGRAIEADRPCLIELTGTPPDPMSRFSVVDRAGRQAGQAPGSGLGTSPFDPDRWSMTGSARWSLVLSRPAAGAPYRVLADDSACARPVEPPIELTACRIDLHGEGRHALVTPRGAGTVYEVDLATAAARTVLERPGTRGASYAPGGLLVHGGGELAFLEWRDGGEPAGPARWRVAAADEVQVASFGDILLAYHGFDRPGLFVHALAGRGPVAMGAAAVTVLQAWQHGGAIYLLDHHDRRIQRRYRLAGCAATLAAAGAGEPVAAIADPSLLDTHPMPVRARRGDEDE